jgi:YHS domain-containing protein
LEKLSIKANVPIGLITSNEPWLQCSASLIGTDFGDAELAALAPVAPNLRWLDLGGTAITDDGLKHLDAMRNVTRLHLERTHISDSGLFHLAALSNLEYLNLYATGISDSGLEVLHKLPKLRQVYLWETKVTPESARAFAESRVDKDQVQRWEREIDQLKSKIRETQFFVLDTGAPGDAVGATNAAPVNTQCPVSGKPIDLAKTLTHNGKLVAFCCDDCKAKFQQDPTPFLAKLEPAMPKPEKTEAKK